MWLLHVIVIAGTSGWQTGAGLALLASLLGGGFAALSGEWRNSDAMLVDLLLAGAGVLAGNAVTAPLGPDPLADLYGVRFACATAGAVLLLVASHDAVYSLSARDNVHSSGLLTGVGSFQYLYTWVSGWPSGAALVEAGFGAGLKLKLQEDALHYQVRNGPLIGSETVPVDPGTRLEARENGALAIYREAPGADGPPICCVVLEGVEPPGINAALAGRFNALVAAEQAASAESG